MDRQLQHRQSTAPRPVDYRYLEPNNANPQTLYTNTNRNQGAMLGYNRRMALPTDPSSQVHTQNQTQNPQVSAAQTRRDSHPIYFVAAPNQPQDTLTNRRSDATSQARPLSRSNHAVVVYSTLNISPGAAAAQLESRSRDPAANDFATSAPEQTRASPSGVAWDGSSATTGPGPGSLNDLQISAQHMQGAAYNRVRPPDFREQQQPPTDSSPPLETQVYGNPLGNQAVFDSAFTRQYWVPPSHENEDRFPDSEGGQRSRPDQWNLPMDQVPKLPYHRPSQTENVPQTAHGQYERSFPGQPSNEDYALHAQQRPLFSDPVSHRQQAAAAGPLNPSTIRQTAQNQAANTNTAEPGRLLTLQDARPDSSSLPIVSVSRQEPTPTSSAVATAMPAASPAHDSQEGNAQREGGGTRGFICQYRGCNKKFDRRYGLTVHYRTHTDEMPYACKVPGCSQRFKWRSSQSHHLRTRHRDVLIEKAPAKRTGGNSKSRRVDGMASNASSERGSALGIGGPLSGPSDSASDGRKRGGDTVATSRSLSRKRLREPGTLSKES